MSIYTVVYMYSIFTIIFAISLLTGEIESDSTVVPQFIYAEHFLL